MPGEGRGSFEGGTEQDRAIAHQQSFRRSSPGNQPSPDILPQAGQHGSHSLQQNRCLPADRRGPPGRLARPRCGRVGRTFFLLLSGGQDLGKRLDRTFKFRQVIVDGGLQNRVIRVEVTVSQVITQASDLRP